MTHAIEAMKTELLNKRRISTLNMPEECWLELRRLGIGASEAADAIGISEYRSQREWTERKLGLVPDDFGAKYRNRMKMQMGHVMEPVTAEMFSRGTGLQVQNFNQMVVHPEHDFMMCNIDRRVVGVTDEQAECLAAIFGAPVGGPGVVELKNVEFGKEWGKPDNVEATGGLCTSGEVPETYYVQVQHQLACMGYEWAFLVVTINGWEVRWYPILRDEATIADIIDLERDAWSYVERKELPAMDLEHPKALDALKRMYPGTDGGVVRLPERLEHWQQVKKDADGQISELKKVSDAAKAQIMAEMKNAAVALCPDGSAFTRKVNKRKAYTVEATEYVDFRHTTRLPKAAEEFLAAEEAENNPEQQEAA